MSAVGDLVGLSTSEAVLLGAESLTLFGRLFLPKTFRQASPSMHDDMGKALYSHNRYNEFLCFRGSAKTTLLRAFTLQRVLYAISRTVMYVSVSQGHAIHSIRWLKRQIERNEKLRIFGVRPGNKWTDEWIEVYHEPEDIYVNIFAVGITGQTRGFNLDDYRPDLIVGDDVLDDENTATPEQRQKIIERWDGALMKSLAPESEAPLAKAVLAQTPFNRWDLAAVLMKNPAWHPVVYSCFDSLGNSVWEARFPTEQLKKDKENAILMGTRKVWYREMECKVVEDELKPFKVDALKFWNTLPQGQVKVIAVDPASSDAKKANKHVSMVVGVVGNDYYINRYEAATNVMPDKAAMDFFSCAMTEAPIRNAVVEVNGYQKTLKWHFEQEMQKRRLFIPIVPRTSKTHKATRILTSIAGILHYGHLYVHPTMTELIEQLDQFDGSDDCEDDLIDALSMAILDLNPAIREATDPEGQVVEGDFSVIDESSYEVLSIEGCP